MELSGYCCILSCLLRAYWIGVLVACSYGIFLFVSHQVHTYPDVTRRFKTATLAFRMLVLLLIVPAALSVLLPFFMYRLYVYFWIRFYHGHEVYLMEGADAVWAVGPKIQPPVINCLFYMSGEPDIKEIQRQALIKGLNLRCPDGSPRFPKLTRYVDEMMGYCVWRHDSSFDIRNHIKVMDGVSEGQTITEKELLTKISILATKNFSPGRPGWEFLLIPSVDAPSARNSEEETYAILVRCHHALCDAASILRFFLTVVNDKPLPHDFLVARDETELSGMDLIVHCLRAASQMPLSLYDHLGRNDHNRLHGPSLSGEKVLAWSDPIETKTIDKIRTKFGTSTKDVLCSSAASALNTFFRKYGHVPTNVIGLMNVTRTQPVNPELVNAFSLLYLRLPTTSMDPVERLRLCRDRNVGQRFEFSTKEFANYWMLRSLGTVVPASLFYYFVEASPSTIAFCSLPDLEGQITFCGNQATDAAYWLPQRGSTGLCLSLISFNGRVRIGLTADRTVVPDREQTQAILRNVVDHVERLASLADQSDVTAF